MRKSGILRIMAAALFGAGLLWFGFRSVPALIEAREGTRDHEHAEAENEDPHAGHDHEPAEAEQQDPHAGDDHEESDVIVMSLSEMNRFGVRVEEAASGQIRSRVQLPGEIRVDNDRNAHVVPRVSGIVSEVRRRLGDPVREGEILAVLESRELADAKADYLGAMKRQSLAEAVFAREERLRNQKISSEQEYLDARQSLEETDILLRSARQKLTAVGLTGEDLRKLDEVPDGVLTRHEIRAPFAGTVIDRQITLGEAVAGESPVFMIADLSTVWLDLHVHVRDLPFVNEGGRVLVSSPGGGPEVEGIIEYVHPVIDEESRTALARATLVNRSGELRPGTFVTAAVGGGETRSDLVVSLEALQYLDDHPVVFVYSKGGFTAREVVPGDRDDRLVEIESGLAAGEMIAVAGGFRLKAEHEKRGAGDIGHGHAH